MTFQGNDPSKHCLRSRKAEQRRKWSQYRSPVWVAGAQSYWESLGANIEHTPQNYPMWGVWEQGYLYYWSLICHWLTAAAGRHSFPSISSLQSKWQSRLWKAEEALRQRNAGAGRWKVSKAGTTDVIRDAGMSRALTAAARVPHLEALFIHQRDNLSNNVCKDNFTKA